MATKYCSQTPYCFMNGFPILKIRASLRQVVSQVLSINKPKKMMYFLPDYYSKIGYDNDK